MTPRIQAKDFLHIVLLPTITPRLVEVSVKKSLDVKLGLNSSTLSKGRKWRIPLKIQIVAAVSGSALTTPLLWK